MAAKDEPVGIHAGLNILTLWGASAASTSPLLPLQNTLVFSLGDVQGEVANVGEDVVACSTFKLSKRTSWLKRRDISKAGKRCLTKGVA